ncbi:hypothetical protein [Mesorhizobium sp. M0633]|uniref:hypothetical protein n=1 Tax=Mesorhizobium sp. M0633 TaxID=2956977 RepID=UPI003339465E
MTRINQIEATTVLSLRMVAEFAGRKVAERNYTGDRFEAAFVARLDSAPIGSCMLVRNKIDLAHDLTPWLAGLVVDEAYHDERRCRHRASRVDHRNDDRNRQRNQSHEAQHPTHSPGKAPVFSATDIERAQSPRNRNT